MRRGGRNFIRMEIARAETTGQRGGALTGRRGGVIDSYTCGRREAAAMALRKFYDEERKRVADNDDCP